MPKGPKGEKRPADVVAAAVKVMRIATGEESDELTDDGKDKAAVSLGQAGRQSSGRGAEQEAARRHCAEGGDGALEALTCVQGISYRLRN